MSSEICGGHCGGHRVGTVANGAHHICVRLFVDLDMRLTNRGQRMQIALASKLLFYLEPRQKMIVA